MATVQEWVLGLEWFPSIQPGRICAGSSERRRLLKDGALELNEERARPDDPMPEEVWSVVFFPKGKRRTSYYYLETWQRGNWPGEREWEALNAPRKAWWRWICGGGKGDPPLGCYEWKSSWDR